MKTTKWRDIKRPGNPYLEHGHRTAAIASMMLCDLREQVGLTQAVMAERLGVSQSWIAQMEAETDMRLSTIASYIAALGGELRLEANLSDGHCVPLDQVQPDPAPPIAAGCYVADLQQDSGSCAG